MNFPEDTIAAVSTPPGEGGIGIIRLSGKDAFSIALKIFRPSNLKSGGSDVSRRIIHGFIVDPTTSESIDEVLVTFMKSPRSYTREDVAEINCHGGFIPIRRILALALREGARLAEPGEFTRRAYLNGRIDLSQAEAVIDVIRAKTEQAEKMALRQLEGELSSKINRIRDSVFELCAIVEAYIDFPEEDIDIPEKDRMLISIKHAQDSITSLIAGFEEGRIYREGAAMAIVGKPNVGKSSLLNALLNKDRAIITDLPGTTRDVIEEDLNIGGLPVRIMDTAGIRDAHDIVEAEGVRRSLSAIEGSDIVLAVYDASRPLDECDRLIMSKVVGKKTISVINKCDILSDDFNLADPQLNAHAVVKISAKNGEGLEILKERIFETLVAKSGNALSERSTDILVTNIRHKQLLERALESLVQAYAATKIGGEPEVAALFLREALDSLGEITGAVATEDILDRIFSQFCIGK